MQTYHGAESIRQILLRICQLPSDHGTDSGNVEQRHNGIDVLVVKIDTSRNQLEVRTVKWLVLVRSECAPRFRRRADGGWMGIGILGLLRVPLADGIEHPAITRFGSTFLGDIVPPTDDIGINTLPARGLVVASYS